jgi:voltage-dependent calcium channel L type alpha-1D
MGSLFIMSNTVQWSDIMYRAAKVREMDYTPQREGIYSSVAAVFFVIIMIIGNFFLMNLFIGVIISTYNREKELMRKDFLMTEKQKKWVQQRIMIIQSQPMYKVLLPHKEWRQPFYYISESPFVKNFILVCIITNTVVLASQWYDQNNHMS